MSKFNVGDKVRVNNFILPESPMVDDMLYCYGGKVVTIKEVYEYSDVTGYAIEEDPWGYVFDDCDLTLVEENDDSDPVPEIPQYVTQRIEIPVPGGHLVAETTGGGDYPAIHTFFVASGSQVEHDLCFAEVCVENNPNIIRVGNYFRDCYDVHNIFEYDMWTKEEDDV